MKKLVKSGPPPALARNSDRLTARYMESGRRTRPWATEEIKSAVTEETDGKCAYCEAKMLSVTYGDIEHIRPKKVFPELVVAWTNLTLACSRCNQTKSSKWDPLLPFVNPFEDEIGDHLAFLGPLVFGVSDRGDYTLNELDLNHPSRIEARNRALREIESLLRRYEAAEGYMREKLRELIELQMTRGDYTAAIRTYVSLRKKQGVAGGVETLTAT